MQRILAGAGGVDLTILKECNSAVDRLLGADVVLCTWEVRISVPRCEEV